MSEGPLCLSPRRARAEAVLPLGVAPAVVVLGVVALVALALATGTVRAQTVAGPLGSPIASAPDEGQYVGRTLPDVPLTAADGRTLALSSLARNQPVLLTLVFSRCVGICSPLLGSLRSAESALGTPGDYRTVVVSFDARDTPSDMGAWAKRLHLSGRDDWTFAVAPPEDVPRLMAAIGFWSRWDEARQQFDHPAVIVGVKGGRVVRMLVGGSVSPVRLQEVVRELKGDFVGTYPLPGRVLVRCFDYDPARGRLVVNWGFLLLLLPAALTAAATLGIFGLAQRQRS